MRVKSFIYCIWALALLFSCNQEELAPIPPEEKPNFHTVPYYAEVCEAVTTKATVDEDYHYVFEAGDRLYVSGVGDNAAKLYGFLHLTTGAGATSAHFEGDLYCADDLELMSSTSISITLVSSNDQIHTISGARVTGTSYSAGQIASDFGEAVSRFSDFTSSGQFGDHAYTLNQQSSFLVFKIRMKAEEEAPLNREITAKLYNDNHDELLREAVITVSDAGSVPFVFAFKGGDTSLNDATLRLEWKDSEDAAQSHDFVISNQALAANNYYTVSRTTTPFDGFRIKAKYDNTTMTFRYGDGSVQFSEDLGMTWATYDGRSFNLNHGDEICFIGNRQECDCNGTYQLFDADKVCYIAGKIGSLLADDSTLATNAFRSAFSNGNSSNTNPDAVTFVDIDPLDPLILPTVTSNSCYKEMFRACTSLTSIPDLPATTLASSCYEGMFSGCSELATIPANLLPATTLAPSCYKDMFSGCSNLTSLSSGQLPATALAESCYEGMFSNCTTLATIPADLLPATTLADMCYHRMFLYCAFTTLPEGLLPATNMTFGCYWKMFEDCRSLTTVPDNLLPAMNLATACYARMFFRCTSLQRGPILPAINPAPACYFVMFRNCKSIKYVKCMLYLDENHRNGNDKAPELAPYNKTEDPPLDNLRTWTVIDMWTVFNKWLTKSPSGEFYNVPNDNTCVYEYNSNMPTSIFSISIAGATLVPSNWTKTPIAPPSTP